MNNLQKYHLLKQFLNDKHTRSWALLLLNSTYGQQTITPSLYYEEKCEQEDKECNTNSN